METFLLSFLIFVVSAAGLALGVIVRKRPIIAGCGQLGGLDVERGGCEVCASEGESERDLARQERPVGTMASE